jgi:hypothetical protein
MGPPQVRKTRYSIGINTNCIVECPSSFRARTTVLDEWTAWKSVSPLAFSSTSPTLSRAHLSLLNSVIFSSSSQRPGRLSHHTHSPKLIGTNRLFPVLDGGPRRRRFRSGSTFSRFWGIWEGFCPVIRHQRTNFFK